ncbi:MAG: hypothetical protein ABI697_12120 [Devosia sp.]
MIAITSFMDAPFLWVFGLQWPKRLKCRANSPPGEQRYDSLYYLRRLSPFEMGLKQGNRSLPAHCLSKDGVFAQILGRAALMSGLHRH